MDVNNLQVNTNIVGGYFSAEQIDLLSIIQCKDNNELIDFIIHCDQIKHNYSKEDLKKMIAMPLDDFKRLVFKSYQDTMVLHDADKKVNIDNKLRHCGIQENDIEIIKNAVSNNSPEIMSWLREFIKNKYPNNYEEIFDMSHHFVSTERDQLKSEDLYEEMVLLNNNLGSFNSMLIGSGKIYNVVNDLYDKSNPDKKFDFYFAKRDLDFAYRNGKQVRYHSLLVKDGMDNLFAGKSKEEILEIIKDYVKESIDFINDYNLNHRLNINGQDVPVINAVDLFNEIVSFEKNVNGEYFNIWESKYGITMDELLPAFDYALQNKPKGVNFLYNEPFLENDERRKKVLEVLDEIDFKRPGLIDTLGSQMHITIGEDENKIRSCFEDFRILQERTGKHIQITEFDMSLGRTQIPRVFGNNPEVTLDQVYEYKHQKIGEISSVINESGVHLDGISYWSLTDGIDCNLERVRSNYLADGSITDIHQIPTACGGLFPTHKKLIKKQKFSQVEAQNFESAEPSHKHR